MAHDVRNQERPQVFLLPPDMRDSLPEDDIVRLILDAVSLMDHRDPARRLQPGAQHRLVLGDQPLQQRTPD